MGTFADSLANLAEELRDNKTQRGQFVRQLKSSNNERKRSASQQQHGLQADRASRQEIIKQERKENLTALFADGKQIRKESKDLRTAQRRAFEEQTSKERKKRLADLAQLKRGSALFRVELEESRESWGADLKKTHSQMISKIQQERKQRRSELQTLLSESRQKVHSETRQVIHAAKDVLQEARAFHNGLNQDRNEKLGSFVQQIRTEVKEVRQGVVSDLNMFRTVLRKGTPAKAVETKNKTEKTPKKAANKTKAADPVIQSQATVKQPAEQPPKPAKKEMLVAPKIEKATPVAPKVTKTNAPSKPIEIAASKPLSHEQSTPDFQEEDLTEINGIGPSVCEQLRDSGITSFVQLASCSNEDLQRYLDRPTPGMDKWIEQAKEMMTAKFGKT